MTPERWQQTEELYRFGGPLSFASQILKNAQTGK
jgi:hypothetical protein